MQRVSVYCNPHECVQVHSLASNGSNVNVERVFGPVNRAMRWLSRAGVVMVALLGVLIVGVPDYLVGYEISLSVFYLVPVGIATWYADRGSGVAIALVSMLSALAADVGAGRHDSHPWLMGWNGLLHLGFMLVVAYLLDSLHKHVEVEQDLARSDPLTGIYNRRAFLEQLQDRLDLASRQGKPITLAYIDLDDFKCVNDRSGHEEGDRVLRLIANTLAASIRRTDIVARLGGDEFALLIVGADLAGAERLIAKVRQGLQQAFAGDSDAVTCSIGCVIFPESPPEADAAIRAADALMYRVKNMGKNAAAFEIYQREEHRPLRLDAVPNP